MEFTTEIMKSKLEIYVTSGWNGHNMEQVPRPKPNYCALPEYSNLDTNKTPFTTEDGSLREVNDFNPRADIKKGVHLFRAESQFSGGRVTGLLLQVHCSHRPGNKLPDSFTKSKMSSTYQKHRAKRGGSNEER